jgi:zinc protease
VSITLDDVKAWYEKVYSLDGAFVVVSGDVTPEQGNELAKGLLAGFERREKVAAAEYVAKERPAKRQIILVDNPQGKQSTIRLGVRSYSLKSDEKFAGMVAGQILSSGIDSRLGKYVRAEKGLTYGVYAFFRPNRQLGEFSGSVDTNPQTTAAAIEAMFKVFGDMRKDLVTDEELAEAKLRVAGGMAMEIQTVAQQAGRRADQILNDYPIDYYDNLPIRVAEVTSEQVREVMNKYVADEQMLIVVVAPASEVKEQLSALGEVSVVPMPLAKPAKAE